MKKILLSSLLTSTLLLGACKQEPDGILDLDDSLKTNPEIVVKINNSDIYKVELSSYVQSRTQKELSELNSDVQNQLFDEFLQLEVLSHKAVMENLQDSNEFKLQVHNLKKNLLAQALLKKFEKVNPITDTELQNAYTQAKRNFEIPQIKARHILLKTAEEAEAVIEQLNKKVDFATLAKEKSTGPTAPKGGDLDWFSPTQMVKPFGDAVISLEVGTYSQKPVATQFGFHVILKEDERIGEAPPLDNLKPRLEQQLKKERLDSYINSLKTELTIENLYTPVPYSESKTDNLK